MFQLVPFFFINQVTIAFILLLIIIYVFSKYILPRLVRLFLTRVFISKLSKFLHMLRSLLERAYESIEWGLNSPPKPHSFVSLPLQSSIRLRGNKYRQTYTRIPRKRDMSSTSITIAVGVHVTIPFFAILFTVLSYAFVSQGLHMCPNAIPGDLYTLTDHSLYLNYLEICSRAWQHQTDLYERAMEFDLATYLELNIGTAQDWHSMQRAMESVQNMLDQGHDIDNTVERFTNLINEVERRIRLMDPNYVNPWSVSEYGESEQEKNQEAFYRYKTFYDVGYQRYPSP